MKMKYNLVLRFYGNMAMRLCGLAMLLMVCSCTDPNEDSNFVDPTDIEAEMKITDILEKYSDEYSMWIEFLKYADFYNALCDANAVATIFCPNNEAVQDFLAWRGVSSIEELDKEYARSVVRTHIISNEKISETSIDNYAKDNTYIPTQNLFGGYLSLRYGHTLVDVDDEFKSDEVRSADSIFINNQAKMERPTVRSCANGSIYTLASVIKPLAETILGKLELEGEYDIFCQAIYETGFDSIANKLQDTTTVIGGGYVVNYYNYTCLAVPDDVYAREGITDLNSLKTYLGGSEALNEYIQYHFLLRKYTTDELFAFQTSGETLIYETKLQGQAIITDSLDGKRIINKSIPIIRSDIEARNGLIDKVGSVMPVYHPKPVRVAWDFLNYADVISFVNAYGATSGDGNIFSNPIVNREIKVEMTEENQAKYGTLTSFEYEANASKGNYYVVGFYKDRIKDTKNPTIGRYGSYMNNYMMLNLGYAGWIKFNTPSIIAGKYKIVLHYCFDVTLKDFYTSGSMTKFTIDNTSKTAYIFKGLTTKDGSYGSYQTTLFDNIEFTESKSHTFVTTIMDIAAKDNSRYHQMLDYLEFIPIE